MNLEYKNDINIPLIQDKNISYEKDINKNVLNNKALISNIECFKDPELLLLVNNNTRNDALFDNKLSIYNNDNKYTYKDDTNKTQRRFEILLNNDTPLYIFIKNIILSSFPVSLSLIFTILLETINIIYVGRLGDPYQLAAIGLGTSFCNLIGSMPLQGIQGGIDSLCTAANGEKEFKLIRIYTNISKLVTTSYFFLVFFPFTYIAPYLCKLIVNDDRMIDLTCSFIDSMIIAIFLVGFRELFNRYLQSMLIFYPTMIINFITLILHPIWAYLFIIKWNYNIRGAGYSLAITQFLNVFFVSLYINYSKRVNQNSNPNSFININKENLLNIFNWFFIKNYLKYSIPACLLNIVEALAFEILVIISSFIGVYQMSATICLFNIGCLVYIFMLGIAITTGSYVGNCVGGKNVILLKKYAISGIIYAFSLTLLIVVFFYIYKSSIIMLYTNDSKIINYFLEISNYYNIYLIFDCLGIIIAGIVRGLGRQATAMKFLIFIMYVFGVPLSLVSVFVLKLGIIGLWQAQMLIVFLYFVSMFYVVKRESVENTINQYHSKKSK